MKIRRNLYSLDLKELNWFTHALLRVKAIGEYDQFIQVHMEQADSIHGTPVFLPWHRAFLEEFEHLVGVANHDDDFAFPYWDWTLDPPEGPWLGKIWLPEILGGTGDPVTDGPFRSGPEWVTVPATTSKGRKFGTSLVRNLSGSGLLPRYDQVREVLVDPANREYEAFGSHLEHQIHNGVHSWVGGQMGWVPAAVNDPVFWLHHANIDRLWEEWQQLYPTVRTFAAKTDRYPAVTEDTILPPINLNGNAPTVGAEVSQPTRIRYQQSVNATTALMCVYPGYEDTELRWSSWPDPETEWQGSSEFGQGSRSTAGTALAFFKGLLYCVYPSDADSQKLVWCTFNPATKRWSAAQPVGTGFATAAAPGLAVYDAKLFCVFRGKSGDAFLYYVTFDGDNWSDLTFFVNGNESGECPALAVLHDTLFCVHRGNSGEGLWWTTFDRKADNWAEDLPFPAGNESNKGPAIAVVGTALYCVHRGNQHDTRLYSCKWDSIAKTWSADKLFSGGNKSGPAPSLAFFAGQLRCVHRGDGDDALWMSTLGPGGVWSTDTRLGTVNRTGYPPAIAVGFAPQPE